MDKYQLRKEIAQLIDSIKEHSDNIGNRKRIPQLELELILSKIKKLYEKSIIFNYLNQIQIDELEEKETPVIPAALEELKVDNDNNEVLNKENEKEQIKATDELIINIQEVEKKLVIEKVIEEEKNQIHTQEKDVIDEKAERKNDKKVSLNEKLSKQVSDVSLLNKLRKKPVEDLVKSIGINERYLFTKELFKGNSESFLQHVRILNSFSSYEEAQQHLEKEIIPKFNWDANNPVVNEFLDLVQRKFIK
jgi:hypothetical protein